jgi:hypothetical protein
MMMIRCNDIASPPLWVLPLVHSPAYLSRLWELTGKVKVTGQSVPLELDNEQTVDDEADADTETASSETTMNGKQGMLLAHGSADMPGMPWITEIKCP